MRTKRNLKTLKYVHLIDVGGEGFTLLNKVEEIDTSWETLRRLLSDKIHLSNGSHTSRAVGPCGGRWAQDTVCVTSEFPQGSFTYPFMESRGCMTMMWLHRVMGQVELEFCELSFLLDLDHSEYSFSKYWSCRAGKSLSSGISTYDTALLS